jgi:hypothetical protein
VGSKAEVIQNIGHSGSQPLRVIGTYAIDVPRENVRPVGAADLEQRWCDLADQGPHLGIQAHLLLTQDQRSSAQFAQRRQCREAHNVGIRWPGPESCGGSDQGDWRQYEEPGVDVVGCGEHDMANLGPRPQSTYLLLNALRR